MATCRARDELRAAAIRNLASDADEVTDEQFTGRPGRACKSQYLVRRPDPGLGSSSPFFQLPARAHAQGRRWATMPTSLPSRTTGTRLMFLACIRCASHAPAHLCDPGRLLPLSLTSPLRRCSRIALQEFRGISNHRPTCRAIPRLHLLLLPDQRIPSLIMPTMLPASSTTGTADTFRYQTSRRREIFLIPHAALRVIRRPAVNTASSSIGWFPLRPRELQRPSLVLIINTQTHGADLDQPSVRQIRLYRAPGEG